MSICKYCGQPIEGGSVMNPDEYGNGYHHFCLVDKEFRDERRRLYNKGKADAFKWIPVSERLPNNHEYIKNNGLFNVSDGNRSYSEWFDIYDTEMFGEPTMTGFHVDRAVTAWMPLPEPYRKEQE